MSIVDRITRKVTGILTVPRLFPRAQISPVIRSNREALRRVPCWIDDATYESSVYRYGLPENIRHLIDKELSEDPTYTDAILHLSCSLRKPIRYLELGVSVGKNFFQVVSFLRNSVAVGFDIEEINPVLERFFEKKSRVEWETMVGSTKVGRSSQTEYDHQENHNKIHYISGDIFDESSWKRLAGRKFNIIFSDAFHDPAALLHEYRMVRTFDLLDREEFLMVWDDLGGEMSDSFRQIRRDLADRCQGCAIKSYEVPLNGWIGRYERRHRVGIVTCWSEA